MIVLDTHAWIWWTADPDCLSPRARNAIEQSTEIGIAAISCWEVATAAVRGRIQLDRDIGTWLKLALAAERVSLAELTPAIAVAAAGIGRDFHGDPGDRLIVATALVLGCSLVTKDGPIRRLPGVKTVW